MELARRPLAREEDLIVEELGDELLVYDTKVDRGHSLSAVAARVWQACDGRTPVEGLCAQLDLDADEVGRAVDELDGCNLLEGTPELSIDERSGRRPHPPRTVGQGDEGRRGSRCRSPDRLDRRPEGGGGAHHRPGL